MHLGNLRTEKLFKEQSFIINMEIAGIGEKIWVSDEEFIKANEKLFIELKTWFRLNRKSILKNPERDGDYVRYNNQSKTAHSRVVG